MPEPPRNPASPAPAHPAGATALSRSRSSRAVVALLVAALVALAVLPYLNALDAGFVYDDAGLVRKHGAVQSDFDLRRVLTASYWEERPDTRLWRPFVTLSFAVNDALADDSARAMHAVNIALHAIATLLGWLFVRRLGASQAAAFATAALFAVHPLHTEAVTWISGRAELFAAIGVFAAALASLRRGAGALAVCAAATFFAVASKESAAVLPFFIAASSQLAPPERRPPLAASLASGAGLFVYLVLRLAVLGTLQGPIVGASENPMVGTGLIERLPTVLDAAGRYVALLVWPRDLAIDYGPPVLGLASGFTAYAFIGTVAAVALAASVALRSRPRLAVASAFVLFFYAVVSNLAVVIGTNFAERLFYLPSFGLLWILAEVGAAAAQRNAATRLALSALLVIALVACGVRSRVRNADYRDDLTLSNAALALHPESQKMLYNRARELGRLGRHEVAVVAAQAALARDANPGWAAVVLADALISLGRGAEAENALRAAVEAQPLDAVPRQRWIQLLDERGEREAADALAEAAIEASALPADRKAARALWARAARAAQSRGELAPAVQRWKRVLESDPLDSYAWTQFGLSLFGLGRSTEARAAFERALAASAENAEAANALAWLLVDAGESARAVELAQRAVELTPSLEFRDTLARALEANGACGLAVEQARLAADGGDPELVERRDALIERCAAATP